MSGSMNHGLNDVVTGLVARHGGNRARRLRTAPIRMVWPVIARKLGISYEVRCKTFFGETFCGVLPEAVTTQVWRTSYYSPDVMRAVLHVLRPGGAFLDIGAHFGFFSLLAASIVGQTGRTLSVEAMPVTYGYLERNMQKFVAEGRSKTVNMAAFDCEKTLEFKDFGIVASSLNTAFERRGLSFASRQGKSVQVRARTADAMLQDADFQPDLIKIDAESSELFVLGGLAKTLATHRPALILELGDAEGDTDPQSRKIWDILQPLGYRPVTFDGPDPVDFHFGDRVDYANVLFLPPETGRTSSP